MIVVINQLSYRPGAPGAYVHKHVVSGYLHDIPLGQLANQSPLVGVAARQQGAKTLRPLSGGCQFNEGRRHAAVTLTLLTL